MTQSSITLARALLVPRAGIAVVVGAMVGGFIAGGLLVSLGADAYRQAGAASTPTHVAPAAAPAAVASAARHRFATNVQDFGFLPLRPAAIASAATHRFATNVQDFGYLPLRPAALVETSRLAAPSLLSTNVEDFGAPSYVAPPVVTAPDLRTTNVADFGTPLAGPDR